MKALQIKENINTAKNILKNKKRPSHQAEAFLFDIKVVKILKKWKEKKSARVKIGERLATLFFNCRK